MAKIIQDEDLQKLIKYLARHPWEEANGPIQFLSQLQDYPNEPIAESTKEQS